jgi:BMFP domain-containing protein YqiC
MADLIDLERRVAALEAANNDHVKTLNWVVGTLGRVAADVSSVKEDVKGLREDLPPLIAGGMRDVQAALKSEIQTQFKRHDETMDRKLDALRESIRQMF